jgi:hypothetical protein
MHVRIGKYVSDKRVKYVDVDMRTNDIYLEVTKLTDLLDDLLHSKNTCSLKKFHSNGQAYMYTKNDAHMKNFNRNTPFWLIVEDSGFFWNLNAIIEHRI